MTFLNDFSKWKCAGNPRGGKLYKAMQNSRMIFKGHLKIENGRNKNVGGKVWLQT